ncbi:MAG: amidohydrolase family protein [Candidatus Rokuibacteriota bacterium]
MRRVRLLTLLLVVLAWMRGLGAVAAEPYTGPLIDAHSHLPSLQMLPTLIAAMDRHRITQVALLGVGGVQKDDLAWIETAAQRYPGRVIAFAPVPDPTAPEAANRLDALLATGRFQGAGEVHVHQASRKIRRAADAPPFLALLDVCARHGVPLVIHDELTPETTAELERALGHNRKAIIILAHAGSGEPRAVADLLRRHENLYLDVSGMHFVRTPALATEKGPLAIPARELLIAHADRILVGLDVWAPQLFKPEMLDRLMLWTRRILGELPPDVAQRLAHANATRLFQLK